MAMVLFGLAAGSVCLLAAAAGVVVALKVLRKPAPKPEATVHTALVEALVHAMGTGPAVPGEHAARAAALARAGKLAEALVVSAAWEEAGGRPTDRGAFNDVRRALETLV
jgi:hypothetical protein